MDTLDDILQDLNNTFQKIEKAEDGTKNPSYKVLFALAGNQVFKARIQITEVQMNQIFR